MQLYRVSCICIAMRTAFPFHNSLTYFPSFSLRLSHRPRFSLVSPFRLSSFFISTLASSVPSLSCLRSALWWTGRSENHSIFCFKSRRHCATVALSRPYPCENLLESDARSCLNCSKRARTSYRTVNFLIRYPSGVTNWAKCINAARMITSIAHDFVRYWHSHGLPNSIHYYCVLSDRRAARRNRMRD